MGRISSAIGVGLGGTHGMDGANNYHSYDKYNDNDIHYYYNQ
jgi:hypothetical protein